MPENRTAISLELQRLPQYDFAAQRLRSPEIRRGVSSFGERRPPVNHCQSVIFGAFRRAPYEEQINGVKMVT
jgi:hypothetical protein